jgi:hypothetical protein
MEAARFSETLLRICQIVPRQIQEESSFHSNCRENLKYQAEIYASVKS